MRARLLCVLSVVVLLAPTPASAATRPKPAVQFTSLSEICVYGWAWVTATVVVNRPGTYDVWLVDDYGLRLNDDGVQVDGSGSFDVSLPNPEQADLIIKAGSVKVAERSVASVPCTHPGW